MGNLTVKLTNVKKSFDAKEVLAIPELAAYENDRIGIIGNNGEGKSTLLKLITGEILPDSGSIQTETLFNYFPQIAEINELFDLDSLDWELAGRMQIPKNAIQTLSGGEETKFRLTQVLSNYQMGLLLDEPTTHLDRHSVETLVEELRYYYGTLIFVSHDRYFLDQLATKIWEVKDGTVREYPGNYTDYKRQRELEIIENQRAVEQYHKQKQHLESAIEKKKAQAQRISQVSRKKKQQNNRPDRLSSSKQKDTVQKAVQKSAKAMESRLSQLEEESTKFTQRRISFPKSKLVEIHNKYPIQGQNLELIRGEKILLKNCDFQFSLGKKIAIVGDNGAGKTTLLQHILTAGAGILLSSKVVFAAYKQMDYKLQGNESILTYLMKQTEYPEAVVRSILNNLGFSQLEVSKPVNGLSGGEATRISIAQLFVQPSNVLILDEPTNFIDLDTIEALEGLIRDYPGTVLLTSHDPYFVANVADEVYLMENQCLTRSN